MSQDLWLNLPVKDLATSIAFYQALGFERNMGPGNTDSSACFMVGEKRVVLMLFLNPVFSRFSGVAISDTNIGAEVLISIGASSAAQVDDFAKRALTGGGRVFSEPGAAGGGMVGCGLCDPDGHRWNVLFMG